MSPPTLDQVLQSYQRMLVAKIQMTEFHSWGESTTGSFRRTIVEHVELERVYIAATVLRRREGGSS